MASESGSEAGQASGRPLEFSGEAVHGGDIWGAARGMGVPLNQVLDLSASLNPLGPPPGLREELDRSFEDLRHYPDRQALELRQALARRHGLDPVNVCPGNGSTALIRLIVRVMDVSPIVVMAPSFGEIPRSLALSGRHFHYLFTKEANAFVGTADDLGDLWEHDPSCVFVTNPVSPSGVCWDQDVLRQLLAQAKRRQCWVVLDEAFIDFVSREHADWSAKQIPDNPRLLVLRSMTKIFCMAGLRLGYLMAHREAIGTLAPLGEPWSVNTMAQRAGVFCLAQKQYLQKTYEAVPRLREMMAERLSSMGLKVYPSQVNYLLTRLDTAGPDAAEVAAACAQSGVLVRDCNSFPGCDRHHLRLAVCNPSDQERLWRALDQAL